MQQNISYQFRLRDAFLGAQNLLIAIGALVLAPILTGLDPNVALFTAGVGTLLFQLITKGKVPVFLGSSFAFVAPTIYSVQAWGIPATLCGLAVSSVAYFIIAALVWRKGLAPIQRFLPPIVTGTVILSIGLVLSPAAVHMASGRSGDGLLVLYTQETAFLLAGISFACALLTRFFAKGWVALLPIFIGVMVSYMVAVYIGVVDFSPLAAAPWFHVPNFVFPEWSSAAVALMFPIALVSAVDHVGGIYAISAVTGKRFVEDPGLHRTLAGSGVSIAMASTIGGPPNTPYAEVTAGVAITKAFNPAIMTWSAIIAIALSSVGKVGAFLQTIPAPTMGGILLILFGTISVVGVQLLATAKVDLMKPRAMTVIGSILVVAVGGLSIPMGSFTMGGMGLGGLVGVILNAILPADAPDA